MSEPAVRPPHLSVVIPNYERPALLRRALRSVLEARERSAKDIEVIVVDDGSRDESCQVVRGEFPAVTLIALAENLGYSVAVNAGVAASNGEWVFTLNNDTTVEAGIFDELLAVAALAPDVGIVAAQQRFASRPEFIYSAGMVLDRCGQAADRLMGQPVSASEREPTEVFGACGAAALYRRSLLAELGGFDQAFVFGLEDADVAWRARAAGWRCVYAPAAVVFHDLGGSVGHGSPVRLFQAGRNRLLLLAKNMDTRQLIRSAPRIVLFDLAYVAYAAVCLRTLAPLRGRLAGLRLWRSMRATGRASRIAVELAPTAPLRAALARRRAWGLACTADSGREVPRWFCEGSDGRHLLVLNQYVVPDAAATGRVAFEVARAAARDGRRVTFIAGQPSYVEDQRAAPRRELRDGVDIRRIRMHGQLGRQRLIRRIAGYVIYLLGATVTGLRICTGGRVDTVLCFHNPPLLPLTGALLTRWGGRRLVCVVQDIHPDVVIATGWLSLPRPLRASWDGLNRVAYGRAAQIVVLSEGMRSVLSEKGVDPAKITVIPMWAEPELTAASPDPAVRAKHGVGANELMLLFVGNVGISQDLESLIEAAEHLVDAPVRFVFVGDGVLRTRWRERIEDLPSVALLPFQPEADYRALVAAADAGVVTLAAGLERLLVPSRAFPFLSAGRPLLAVMSPESELGRLVEENDCGSCVRTAADIERTVAGWLDDRDALLRAGAKARTVYSARYARDLQCERYVALLTTPHRVTRDGD
jgi:GT2 family glycosyltransferase/glycosyltransferase involved in cell wall biosynthesis